MSQGDRNPIVMSPANWEGYLNTIGDTWFRRMGMGFDDPMRLNFTALEFAGEAGELANKLKKRWRDGYSPESFEATCKEFADVRMLLKRIERFLGIDGEQICADKVEELFLRWPDIPKVQTRFHALVGPNYGRV